MICSSSTTSRTRRLAAGLLLVALAVGPARGGTSVGDALAKARTALAKGDGIAAEVPLRQALRQGVPLTEVRAELGDALLLQGNRQEARKVLYGGAFPSGTEARGWRLKGRLELVEGNLGAAGYAFDQALRLAPDEPSLWIDIARLRFMGGEEAQAIEAADRAVRLAPRDPRSLELRGLLVREQVGLRAALPWFEAGLAAAPDDIGLLGEYAATLGDLGQYRAMLVVCRKLAKVDPGNLRALYLQAVLAARAGRIDLARKIMQQTGTAFRDVPAAMLVNGLLEYQAGNANLAVGYFDRLVRTQPDNLQARTLLARALEREGLNQQALDVAGQWAQSASASRYLLMVTADALSGLSRKREGEQLRGRAARAEPVPATVIPTGQPLGALAIGYGQSPNLAATAVPYIRGLIEAGSAGEAVAVADRLRQASPGAAGAWLLAGDARLMSGDFAEAEEMYGRAAVIRFNLPTLQRIDLVLRRQGKAAEANALVARYLWQNPGSPQAMKLLSAGRAELGDAAGAAMIEAVLRARGLRNPS